MSDYYCDDLEDFVMTAWEENLVLEDNDEIKREFISRFFKGNVLQSDEFLEYVEELLECMEVRNERMRKLILRSIPNMIKNLEKNIQEYYNEELKEFHEVL